MTRRLFHRSYFRGSPFSFSIKKCAGGVLLSKPTTIRSARFSEEIGSNELREGTFHLLEVHFQQSYAELNSIRSQNGKMFYSQNGNLNGSFIRSHEAISPSPPNKHYVLL
jgi:hypothetical protein